MKELNILQNEMMACRLCAEEGFQITPGAIFSGRVGARVMIIGQAPGVTEVAAKRPFNAGSGRRLFMWLEAAGYQEESFRQEQYMTAVTKCYPGKNGSGRGDRVPSKAEQRNCRPFLNREITLINPRLIIPVGGLAIGLFFPAKLKLKDIIGKAAYSPPGFLFSTGGPGFPDLSLLESYDNSFGKDGCWIVPLPHPSGASIWPNRPENKVLIDRAIDILMDIRNNWRL